MSWRHCLLAAALALLATQAPAGMPACQEPALKTPDVVPDTVFQADLAPFGPVCFAARKVAVPAYGETDYLQFELLRDGAVVATLPRPERYLWSEGCRVMAVSFPRLGQGPQRSIVVLGRCNTAQDELTQPLLYRGDGKGFAIDTPFSVDAAGLDSVAKVVAKARKAKAG